MKKTLPNNAKIAKDAKESIQECVSEFISFITSEASDKCQQEKRKTINGDDILWYVYIYALPFVCLFHPFAVRVLSNCPPILSLSRAMSTLGFDRYVEPLKLYLAKYRDSVRGDRPDKKGSDEYGAQPKMSSHSSSMGGIGDAPIFAFESTSGVMVRIV